MLVDVVCAKCGKEFKRLKKQQNLAIRQNTKAFFCSLECRAKSQLTGYIVPCAVCGHDVYKSKTSLRESKSGLHFCSKVCSNGFNNKQRTGKDHPGYINGKSSYRTRALGVYGKACTVCGYNIECVLEVHHRDGDREHNEIENLDVLCPTHHVEFECGLRKY